MSVVSRSIRTCGGKLSTGGAEYSQTWQYELESSSEGPVTIFNHLKLNGPYIGSHYESGVTEADFGSYCQEIEAPTRPAGSEVIWYVTLHYKPLSANSKLQPNNTDGTLTANPLDWRPKIHIGYMHGTEPVEQAIYRLGFTHDPEIIAPDTRRPVTNSTLKEVFDPPFEKDKSRKVIRVRLNSLTFDDSMADEYIDAVNSEALTWRAELSGTFSGYDWGISRIEPYARYTLKVANITASPRRENIEIDGSRYDVEYYEIEVELHYNADGWGIHAVDRGLMRKASPGDPDGRGGTLSLTDMPPGMAHVAPVVDFDNMPVNHPVLLNGAGQPLQTDTDDPVILYYSQYEEIDISLCDYIGAVLL